MIVGLGNPGRKYKETRHNMGYEVVDKLADDFSISFNKIEQRSVTGRGIIKGQSVMLVKPHTFMNLSGDAVIPLMNYYKIPLDKIIIVYDEVYLPLGTVMVKRKGSSGGQKGIEHILHRIGHENVQRVKIGIGPKPLKIDVVDFVLGKVSKQETEIKQIGIEKGCLAVELFVAEGIDEAMSKINGLK